MYKLIAIDMDGTLLNSSRQITDDNKKAIAKAREKGVYVVLASGRPLDGMAGSLAELDMNQEHDYVLSYNAALIQKVKDKSIVRQQALSGKQAKEIALMAEKVGVNYHAFSVEEGLITPKSSRYTEHEQTINGVALTIKDFSTLADDDLILKIMMVDEPETLTAAINKLPKEMYDQYSIVQSAPYFLEFMHKNSNKGTGVKALAEYLSISSDEVICIGDQGNDHAMIEYAGLGVAMGNGSDETKAMADYITATNDESGVARVIEKYVLGE